MPRKLVDERNQFRRSNRLLGHYLATCCWIGRVDAVVLSRKELEQFFFTTLHDARRVDWLVEDVGVWFPHHKPLVYRSPTVASLYLSRVQIADFPGGRMPDEERVDQLLQLGHRIALYSDLDLAQSQVGTTSIERIAAKMLLVSTGDIDVTEDIYMRSKSDFES